MLPSELEFIRLFIIGFLLPTPTLQAMGQPLGDGSRVRSQPSSRYSHSMFVGEAAVKGQLRLPGMGCNAQPVPWAPSSSNPRRAPPPALRTGVIYRAQGITAPRGHLQNTGTAGANLVPHPRSSSEQLQSPKASPPRESGLWEGKQPPNGSVSKLGLALGSLRQLL